MLENKMTTPTLEQKIEAEYKELYPTKWHSMKHDCFSVRAHYEAEFAIFKAAALPLHEEIEKLKLKYDQLFDDKSTLVGELREALDVATREWVEERVDYVKLLEFRTKFKLDEVQS